MVKAVYRKITTLHIKRETVGVFTIRQINDFQDKKQMRVICTHLTKPTNLGRIIDTNRHKPGRFLTHLKVRTIAE